LTDSQEKDFDLEFGDYDLEEDVTPVPVEDALPYPDSAEVQGLVEEDPKASRLLTVSAARTPAQALATARQDYLDGHNFGVGHCLIAVQSYYGVPGGYPYAISSWQAADHKRPVAGGHDVPRGAPVYWSGGSHGYGHVAISMGGGLCYSTDWKRPGKVDVALIDNITSHWELNLLGFAWEVSAVGVWHPRDPIGTVSLANVKPGKRNKDVLEVKKALAKRGYGNFSVKSELFGKRVQEAYAKFQHHLGYTGTDANGIPGRASLRKLGFNVVA